MSNTYIDDGLALALPNLLIVMIGMSADVVTNVAMSLITMRVLKNHLVSLFSSWMSVLQWMIWEAHSFVSNKQHRKSGPSGSLQRAITATRYTLFIHSQPSLSHHSVLLPSSHPIDYQHDFPHHPFPICFLHINNIYL